MLSSLLRNTRSFAPFPKRPYSLFWTTTSPPHIGFLWNNRRVICRTGQGGKNQQSGGKWCVFSVTLSQQDSERRRSPTDVFWRFLWRTDLRCLPLFKTAKQQHYVSRLELLPAWLCAFHNSAERCASSLLQITSKLSRWSAANATSNKNIQWQTLKKKGNFHADKFWVIVFWYIKASLRYSKLVLLSSFAFKFRHFRVNLSIYILQETHIETFVCLLN